MKFTPEQVAVLKRFFTDTEGDIFALINIPEVVKGTLFSRYSRSGKDLRTLFIEEFYNAEGVGELFAREEGAAPLDVGRAEDFYERVLVGYGDDSVAELGGAHAALENISCLATKSIEEHRLGLSPLEKSTRYVYFDKKIDGRYAYYRPEKLMTSKYRDLYLEACDGLFDAYSTIVRDIQPVLLGLNLCDPAEAACRASIRAKACDLARGLLPLSTVTNMGVFGNGRAFEYLITNLLRDPLDEARAAGLALNENLRQVIPAFVKRATNERGEKYRQYLDETERNILPYLRYHSGHVPISEPSVELLDYDLDAVERLIAAAIYERNSMPFAEARGVAQNLSDEEKERILREVCGRRENRHHKPPRFFEEPYFCFEITADWGVYKDLQRHRILTRYKQQFTSELGYIVPEEITRAGFDSVYRAAMDRALAAFRAIKEDFPAEAQYLVTHGSYNRFYIKLNLRALVHLVELRSSPQGHPTYRKVAQKMALAVAEKMPLLGKYVFRFVDYNDYELERLAAFRRLEEKGKSAGVEVFAEEKIDSDGKKEFGTAILAAIKRANERGYDPIECVRAAVEIESQAGAKASSE